MDIKDKSASEDARLLAFIAAAPKGVHASHIPRFLRKALRRLESAGLIYYAEKEGWRHKE